MVVIAYDIKDEKRLRKVAKYFENNGIRAQRSVFEVDVCLRKAKKIFNGVKKIINCEEDKCFMFVVNKKEDIQADTSIERIL